MITKALVQSLLKVVQSPAERTQFAASHGLRAFVGESGIGTLLGNKIVFSVPQKERIRALLFAEGVNPAASPDAWSQLNRSTALAIGPDEKWAGTAVRANRIAIKALHGKPLLLGLFEMTLPPGANLDYSVASTLAGIGHECIVVVENWEAFERIDDLDVDMSRAGTNPLVLWRGGAKAYTVGAAARFLAQTVIPVWSAPDYDPAGLAIAARLPRLQGVLAPSLSRLGQLLQASKLRERYFQQIDGALTTLEQTDNPDVRRLWALVKASCTAVPQEYLLSVQIGDG